MHEYSPRLGASIPRGHWDEHGAPKASVVAAARPAAAENGCPRRVSSTPERIQRDHRERGNLRDDSLAKDGCGASPTAS